MVEASVDQLRSRARAGLADPAERAGARAHFRAMGIGPTRLGGPIIGVASTWTGTKHEVIADSIGLMLHAYDLDGLVCVLGCDKTVPAAAMALAGVDKPALLVYSGPMRARLEPGEGLRDDPAVPPRPGGACSTARRHAPMPSLVSSASDGAVLEPPA
jgi:dihydroxyacid dehydratase/phosphogluconate dehydratase